MFDQCYVIVNPTIMIVLAVAIAAAAVYLTYITFKGERTAFLLVASFVALLAMSVFFMACWAFAVSIIELVIAFVLRRRKIRTVYVA
jgi:hypothetical protein